MSNSPQFAVNDTLKNGTLPSANIDADLRLEKSHEPNKITPDFSYEPLANCCFPKVASDLGLSNDSYLVAHKVGKAVTLFC